MSYERGKAWQNSLATTLHINQPRLNWVHDVRTADLTVKGVGQVDVYTPNSTNPTSIVRTIEGKNNQANAVLVQTSIADADMATVAARTWGKPTAQNIQTIFFQKPDGTIVRFNRPTGG